MINLPSGNLGLLLLLIVLVTTACLHACQACYRDNSKKIDETGRRVAKILSKDDTIQQTELLRQELTRLQLQIGFNVLLPFGLKVGPVVPEKCIVMRSKAKPFILVSTCVHLG